MQAAGLTADELKQKIEESLKQYLDVVNVTVMLDTVQSERVFVAGRVAKSGAIVMQKENPLTVMQALTLAGWIVDFAKSSEIVVFGGYR
jgi:protein involved in polysaccharide export with SLBB domain